MKLTPGRAFTPVAPQSVRTQSSCQYLFMLSGSARAKAARRTLLKLTPGNFGSLTLSYHFKLTHVSLEMADIDVHG